MLLAWEVGNAVNVVVSEEWIALPVDIAKAQRDVVTEVHVAQQELEVRSERTVVNIVRRLPTEDVACAFCEHTFEAHLCCLSTDVIAVDERRVAKHLRLFAEVLLHLLTLALHFLSEALFVGERSKTV